MSTYLQLLSTSPPPWHKVRALPILEVVHRYSGDVEEANYLRWSNGIAGPGVVLTPPGVVADFADSLEEDLAFLGSWHLTVGAVWYDEDGDARFQEAAVYKTGSAEVLEVIPSSLVPWAWWALISAELRLRHELESGGWAGGFAGGPPLELRGHLYKDLAAIAREADIADQALLNLRSDGQR